MRAEPALKNAALLLKVCRAKKLKIALAESCTGGLAAAAITSIPGASEIFECGFVTYANAAKITLLGVPPALIKKHGAVSAECATAMAVGARREAKASIALSITGIAGPGGGSGLKPVGLVFIGIASRKRAAATRHVFKGSRQNIRAQSVSAALRLLLETVKSL